MNNNYNSNTVVKQEFAVVEEVDGQVNSPEKKLQHTCAGGVRKIFLNRAPKKICTPLPDHAGSIPVYKHITMEPDTSLNLRW